MEEEAEGEGISSIIIPEHPSENVTSIIQLMLLIQFSKLMILGHPRNLFPLCCREMVPDFTFLQISVIPGVRMSPHQDIYKTINSICFPTNRYHTQPPPRSCNPTSTHALPPRLGFSCRLMHICRQQCRFLKVMFQQNSGQTLLWNPRSLKSRMSLNSDYDSSIFFDFFKAAHVKS